MTGDSKLLYDFMEAIQPFMSIVFGGGSKGQVLGLGKVAITNDMSLANVMLVQSLKYHLFSVRQLASVGYDTLFGLTDVKVFKSCLLYTSPSPRDGLLSRMPSSA